MLRLACLTTTLLLLSSCTWVQLTEEGETVMLAGAGNVNNCERVGRATARTLDEVVRVDRSGQRLQEELLVLARNEAAAMGGNTIGVMRKARGRMVTTSPLGL